MASYRYTSPLRPLDIGYAARVAHVDIDWEQTTVGPWTPASVYAFTSPLSEQHRQAFELELQGA